MTVETHGVQGVLLPWSERIGNAAIACVTYVVQLFYPVDLVAYYPTPQGGPADLESGRGYRDSGRRSAAAVIWRRRCPYCFVGWFWYLGMLSPVLGVVKIGWHAMADRYMYLPGIGLSIALAWGAARLLAGSFARRWVLGTCAGLAIAVLTACAAWQTSVWRDDETLVERTHWRARPIMAKPNSAWPTRWLDKADSMRRFPTIAGPRAWHTITIPTANSVWCSPARATSTKRPVLFRQAVEIEPDAVDARCIWVWH